MLYFVFIFHPFLFPYTWKSISYWKLNHPLLLLSFDNLLSQKQRLPMLAKLDEQIFNKSHWNVNKLRIQICELNLHTSHVTWKIFLQKLYLSYTHERLILKYIRYFEFFKAWMSRTSRKVSWFLSQILCDINLRHQIQVQRHRSDR